MALNNQELGSRFHSFRAKTYMIHLENFLPRFFVSLVLARTKDKTQNFDVSLCLYHFYGTACAMKIKELLRNF